MTPTRRHNTKRGMALVITLALLVLVTFLIVAFFSLATANRGTESIRARGHTSADLSRDAEDWLVGSILTELGNASTLDSSNGVMILNDPPATLQRRVASPLSTDASFASLRQQSLGANGTNALHSTADPAGNGRRIAPDRWNAPRLVAAGASFSAATAPKWLYLRADGTVHGTPHADAVARIAFNLYDIAGLLDANVAGSPTTLTATEKNEVRGTPAAADLSALGISDATINQLLGFRHANLSNFPQTIANLARSGFMEGEPGSRRFASRQDLIRYATRENPGLEAALPLLTHFSREVAAPSWNPQTPSGSSMDYASQANLAAASNRFFPRVRAAGDLALTRYRDDGTSYTLTLRAGESLVSRRFSLAKLAWIGAGGPVTATPAAIQACFGLTWNNSLARWDYTAGTTGSVPAIKTLAQVAAENREPNFFELLKAGILSGSLGIRGGGGVGSAGGLIFPDIQEADADYQILQIGANMVDQWDTDSIPTAIGIDRAGVAWEAVGIESLPGIAQVKAVAGKSPDAPTNRVAIYFLANLWNPSPASGGSKPTLRLTVRGSVQVDTRNVSGTTRSFAIPPTSLAVDSSLAGPGIVPGGGLGSGTSAGLGWAKTPSTLGNYAGFRLPDYRPAASDTDPLYGGSSANNVRVRYTPDNNNPFQISLDYEAAPGVWRSYSFLTGNNDPATWAQNNFQQWIAGGYPATVPIRPPDFSPALLDERPSFARMDPRVRRFTPVQFDNSSAGMFSGTLWSDTSSSTGLGGSGIQLAPASIWSAGSSSVYPALLARNNASASRYADKDGINRIADSGLFTGSGSEGNPYANPADRPIVLNRPFRSVAEMGAACRDLPFRSLDFFTTLSADSALLDLFCLSDIETPLRAGVVSLNSPHEKVLSALLSGTPTRPDATPVLSLADANTLAASLVTKTSASPVNNPSDLTSLAGNVYPSGTDSNRKPSRETLARALAGLVQTRTWNLLADIIVQNGRFPANGSTNADNWNIEGESRNWAVLAIDRFTARIVDRQSEIVIE
ncbi:MAG: hypothetical protein Fur0032_23570 [Terrimicrobiaceae bacterium]